MTIFAYADDIIILDNTQSEVIHTIEKLIKISNEIGLIVNEAKTGYIIMSRNLEDINHLKVDNFGFEQVEDFKYLVVNINHSNKIHSKVKQRITMINRAYFAMNKILSSKMLSLMSEMFQKKHYTLAI